MNAYYLPNIHIWNYALLVRLNKWSTWLAAKSNPLTFQPSFCLLVWWSNFVEARFLIHITWVLLTGLIRFGSLIYFSAQFAYIGLPYLFYEYKGVGLWLWAPGELNWTRWYIVLFTSPWFTWYCNFFLLKLFHCRLVETVQNWACSGTRHK